MNTNPAQNAQETLIPVRAAANRWISENLGEEKRYLVSSHPVYDAASSLWRIQIIAKPLGGQLVGEIEIDCNLAVVSGTSIQEIVSKLHQIREDYSPDGGEIESSGMFGLSCCDGVAASSNLADMSVDMLLTDPPYGISSPYICEQQIPRRLRSSGSDFIMPKGEFGPWDHGFSPEEWTGVVLPKIRGWCVIFCAQAQIGQYTKILKNHKFVAIGTLVWHKTNPVPFNHKFKLLNSWEAAVVGKRPGTRFHGQSVHNVFTFKSPSPKERIHPTQKPLALVERLIELFTSRDDLILDPFAGSATTVLGSIRMSRRCIAFENDPGYYRASVVRLKKHHDRCLHTFDAM